MSDQVAHEVLRAIRRVMRRVAEYSRHLSGAAGLTVPQLMCIKAIGEQAADPPTVAQLADRVHLSAATTSRIVDRLVKGGWVTRSRSATDRRRVHLALTADGEARYAALPAPLQERFVRRFLALPETERASILAALERITELMDAEDVDAAPMLTADEMSSSG